MACGSGRPTFGGQSAQCAAILATSSPPSIPSMCARAGLVNLHFHDLRHTSTARVIEAALRQFVDPGACVQPQQRQNH
jgi:hypothetical protein